MAQAAGLTDDLTMQDRTQAFRDLIDQGYSIGAAGAEMRNRGWPMMETTAPSTGGAQAGLGEDVSGFENVARGGARSLLDTVGGFGEGLYVPEAEGSVDDISRAAGSLLTGAADWVSEAIGNEDWQDRLAQEEQDKGFGGKLVNAVQTEGADMAISMGAMALTGGAATPVLAAQNYGRALTEAKDRQMAEFAHLPEEERDAAYRKARREDPALYGRMQASAATTAALDTLTDMIPVLKGPGKQLFMPIAEQAMKKAIARNGGKIGTQAIAESVTELAQTAQDIMWNDNEVRGLLTSGNLEGAYNKIVEKHGEELMLSAAAGGVLGGGGGAVAAGVQSKQGGDINARSERVEGILAEQGIDKEKLTAILGDEEKRPEFVKEATALEDFENTAELQERQAAAIESDERASATDKAEARKVADQSRENANQQRDKIATTYGGVTVEAKRRMEEEELAAREKEVKSGFKQYNITPTKEISLDEAEPVLKRLKAATDNLDTKRAAAARVEGTAVSAERKEQRSQELSAAVKEQREALIAAHMMAGDKKAQEAVVAVKRQQAIDKHRARLFPDEKASTPEDVIKAADAVLAEEGAKKQPQKVAEKIKKKEEQLRQLDDPEEIDKVEAELQELRAKSLPTSPVAEAALAAKRDAEQKLGRAQAELSLPEAPAAEGTPSPEAATGQAAPKAGVKPTKEAAGGAGPAKPETPAVTSPDEAVRAAVVETAKAERSRAQRDREVKMKAIAKDRVMAGDEALPKAKRNMAKNRAKRGEAALATINQRIKDATSRIEANENVGKPPLVLQPEKAVAPAAPEVTTETSEEVQARLDARNGNYQSVSEIPKASPLRVNTRFSVGDQVVVYRDYMDEFGKVTAEPGEVQRWLRQKTEETGHEYSAVLDEDGRVLGIGTINDENGAYYSETAREAMSDPKRRVTYIHTHPEQNTFSSADMVMLKSFPGMSAMVAVMPDGAVRRASRAANADSFTYAMGRQMQDAAGSGLNLRPGREAAIRQEAMMRALAEQGYFSYTSDPALTGSEINNATRQAGQALTAPAADRLGGEGLADTGQVVGGTGGTGVRSERPDGQRGDTGDTVRAGEAPLAAGRDVVHKDFHDAWRSGVPNEQLIQRPEFVTAVGQMMTRPATSKQPGFNSDAWHADRQYTIDGKQVRGTSAALEQFLADSKTLAARAVKKPVRPIQNGRILTIVTGPPASGKSTISEEIAYDNGSAILDSDEYKKALPEFGNGEGANAVHKESKYLAEAMEEMLTSEGANIVYPKVGHDIASTEKLARAFKEKGYTVNVVNLDVPPNEAMRRMLGRFGSTGRLIPPSYLMDDVGDKPSRVYDEMAAKGEFDGYAKLDGLAPYGETPGVLDQRGGNPLAGTKFEVSGGPSPERGQGGDTTVAPQDTGQASQLARGIDIARTAEMPREEGVAADPEKVAGIISSLMKRPPAGVKKMIKSGELTEEGAVAGYSHAINSVSSRGSEASTVVLEAALRMFPDAKLDAKDFIKVKTDINGKPITTVEFPADWAPRLNAAWQMLVEAGSPEGLNFGLEKMPIQMKRSGRWITPNHLVMTPKLQKHLGIKVQPGAEFTRPMTNPTDTMGIIRTPKTSKLPPEAVDIMRKTAVILQSNTYQLDQARIASMTPDDLISDKGLGSAKMKRDDDGTIINAEKGNPTLTPDQEKYLKTQRFRAKSRLGMLQRMAKQHGDQPIGFRYRVDDKGRITADGAFNPQTGDAIKAAFLHPEFGSLGDMPTVDHSASGWQIAVLLARDDAAASFFNLGSNATQPALQEGYVKQDMYNDLMNDLRARVERDAAGGDKRAAIIKEKVLDAGAPFGKAQVKAPVIAVNYGAGHLKFQEAFMDVYGDNFKGVDNKDMQGVWGYIGGSAYESLEAKAPRTMAFQKWALGAIAELVEKVEGANPYAPPKLEFTVGLNGKYAAKKLKKKPAKMRARHRKDGVQLDVEQTVNVEVPEVDALATARTIWSQLIQGFDASILHDAIPAFMDEGGGFVTSNHDSYTVPKGKAGQMAAVARRSMKKVMEQAGNVPQRLYDELKAMADINGVVLEKLDTPDFDPSVMGDYDLDNLDTAVPLFTENVGDAPPAYTDTEGNLLPGAPSFNPLARGIDYEASETGSSGVKLTTSLPKMAQFAQDSSFNKGRELKVAMQEMSLASQKEQGIDLTKLTPENVDRLADFLFEDAKAALVNNQNAVGWYDKTVTKALDTLARLYPEIKTDPDAKFAFTWALAVTSNGLKVDKNFELAAKAYDYYREHKTFPKKIGIGQAAKGINDGLAYYDQLIKKTGSIAAARELMVTQAPVREIEAKTGIKISGEGKGEIVRGAAILGPKIGNGFFSNLYGHFDALTMDRWLMRSVGRWRGTLIAPNPAMEAKKRGEIRELFKGLSPEELTYLRGFYNGSGIPIRKVMSDANIDALSVETAKRSMAQDWRANINEAPGGEALRKLGNALAKYLDGQVEAPAGTKERSYLREVFKRGHERLIQEPGMEDLTMSDLQALIWYPEKLLYDTAKKSVGEERTGYENDEAPDYAVAAEKLVRDRLGPAGPDGSGRGGGRPTERGAGGSGPAAATGDVELLAAGVDAYDPTTISYTPARDLPTLLPDVKFKLENTSVRPRDRVSDVRHSDTDYERDAILAVLNDGGRDGPSYRAAVEKNRQLMLDMVGKANLGLSDRTAMTAAINEHARQKNMKKTLTPMNQSMANQVMQEMGALINEGRMDAGDIARILNRPRAWAEQVAAKSVAAASRAERVPFLARGIDMGMVKAAPKKKGISQPVSYKTSEKVARAVYQGAANKGGTFDNLQRWFASLGRATARQVFDKRAGLSQIETLVGKGDASVHDGMAKFAQMMMANTGRIGAMMQFGAPKWNAAKSIYEIDRSTKGLDEIFKFNDVDDYQKFQGWAYAKRDRDLMSRGKSPRMTADLLADFEDISEAQKARYDAMLDEYKKFNGALRNLMKDSGLIDDKMKAALEEDNEYVPMYRVFDDPSQFGLQNVFPGGKDGFSHPDPGVKGMVQGAKKVGETGGGEFGDLLEGIHNNAVAVVTAASQNLAHQRVYKFMSENEHSSITAAKLSKKEKKAYKGSDAQDAVKFYKDGKEFYWRSRGDPEWTGAMQMAVAGLSPAQTDALDMVLKKFNAFQRRVITATPAFAFRSVIRDMGQAYVQSETNPLSVVKKNSEMLLESFGQYSQSTQDLMMASGVGGYQMQGMPEVDAQNLRRKVGAQEAGRLHQVSLAFGAYERVLGGTELAARSAVYEGELGKTGGDQAAAAFEALNMIDYGRHGASRAIQRLTYMVLFLNPRLQGLYRLFETSSGDPKERYAAVSRALLSRGLVLTAVSLGIRALTALDDEDEERYRALSVADRASYYHIPIPGSDRFLRLPKPFEVGAAFGTLPVAAFDTFAMGEEGFNDLGMMASHVFMETFSFNPTPQAVKPVIEVMLNRNMFTGREIEGMRLEGLPKALRAELSTGGLARALGNKLISPAQIQHLLKGYLGPLGMFAVDVADGTLAGAGIVPDRAQRPEGVFGSLPTALRIPANFMLGWSTSKTDEEGSDRYTGSFYDLQSRIRQYTSAINEASRMGDVDEVNRLKGKSADIMRLKAHFNKVSSQLSKLNQQLRVAQLAPNKSAEWRQKEIARINIKKNELVRGAMERARNAGVGGSFLGGLVGDTVAGV